MQALWRVLGRSPQGTRGVNQIQSGHKLFHGMFAHFDHYVQHFRRLGYHWEQHVRRPRFQQVRGHHSGCWNLVMQSPRTRHMRCFAVEQVAGFGCCQKRGLHSKLAASRRGSWGGPESPSTEDACLRCWLNSNSPCGDGAARHWGCCHRTLVSARARDETRRRTADSFRVYPVLKGEQVLRQNLHCRF